jgi:hypothetical protein
LSGNFNPKVAVSGQLTYITIANINRFCQPPLSGIVEVFPARIADNSSVTAGFPFGHIEVLILPVTALRGSGAGNGAVKSVDPIQHFPEQRENLPGTSIAFEDHIEPCAAAHGAKIYNPAAPFLMGPEESGPQVFNGMQGGDIYHRFPVWFLETEIEGGKYHIAEAIFPGNIHPRLEPEVIDLKTGYLFHNASLFTGS